MLGEWAGSAAADSAVNGVPERTTVSVGGRAETDDFVGRDAEWRALHSELDQMLRGGLARTVLLEGPAGIGKSRLLHRFLSTAVDVRVVKASGDEDESRLDFGVVDQLVARAGSATARGSMATDPGVHRDPVSIGSALLELLGELAVASPVIVVVDDAHWADAPSLQAVTFALRRLYADRVLAVVATREATGILPEGLLRLADERGSRVSISALGESDLAQLARLHGADDLSAASVKRLWEHTGGNPLYARALLEELGPDALRRPAGPLPAPRSFAMVVASRLATCDVAARNLVQAASVLGSRTTVGLAARVAGIADPCSAVEQACAARLLEVIEDPMSRAVAFPHPLVRAAVYHDLGPARRSALHGRAGDLLEGTASLEHRAAAELVEDGVLAAELADCARTEADQGAPIAAATHLVEAARLSPAQGEKEPRLLDAVDLLLGIGEVTQAVMLAADVSALPYSCRRSCTLGYLAFVTGRRDEAEKLLVEAWEHADPAVDAGLRAQAAGLLAQLHALDFHPEEVVRWSRRSLEAGNPDSPYPSALTMLVSYLALLGCPDEALAQVAWLAEDQAELSEGEVEGLVARGVVRGWTGDFPGAHADLATAVEALDRRLASGPGLMALGGLAHVECRLGSWDPSVARACLAVSLATDAGQGWMLSWVHSHAVWVLAARGAWHDAEAHVRAAEGAAQAMGDQSSRGCAITAKVYLAFCRGDPAGVVDAAEELAAMCRIDTEEPGVHAWRELYAEALVALGRLDDADAALQPLERLAAVRNRRVPQAAAARARGVLEAARGNGAAARQAFETALALLEAVPVPFEKALAHEAYGRFLRRSGSRQEATSQLHMAREQLAALSAQPFVERVDRELRACGLTPRRRSSGVPTDLTPQELAVAQLVAAGRTNREVAAELFISAKTVEYHLGHIFTKLGVTSRRLLRDRVACELPQRRPN